MADQRKGYVFALMAGALWGIQGLFIKLMTQVGASTGQISFCRTVFSFAILAAMGFITKGKGIFAASRRTLICCMFMGLFWQCVFNYAYSTAVQQVGMAVSAVLLNISPVFIAVISRLTVKERFPAVKLAALALNVIGCTLAATGGDFSGAAVSVLGIAMGLLAALMYSISAIIGRFASRDNDPLTVNIYMFLFASLFVAAFFRPWEGIEKVMGAATFWVSGSLYALLSTVLAFLLYLKSISTIREPSKAPVFASVEIVVAGVMGVALFREKMNFANILGAALVFLSIYIMNRARPAETAEDA